MRNGHQRLLCKREILGIAYETINRKNKLRGVVTDTADTTIALHQKTYVTTVYGLIRRRMMMIKCEKTEDEDLTLKAYTKESRMLETSFFYTQDVGGE